jgi:hypothetical protein
MAFLYLVFIGVIILIGTGIISFVNSPGYEAIKTASTRMMNDIKEQIDRPNQFVREKCPNMTGFNDCVEYYRMHPEYYEEYRAKRGNQR